MMLLVVGGCGRTYVDSNDVCHGREGGQTSADLSQEGSSLDLLGL
jgi:hypothetical protein